MRTRALLGTMLLALSASLNPTHAETMAVSGPDPFILTFDENGNGSYQVCTNTQPPSGCGPVTSDPGTIIGGALAYRLPSAVGLGDVTIDDPSSAISDGLRFAEIGSNFYMFYYSVDTTGGAEADTGLPSGFNTSFVGAVESGNTFDFVAGFNNNIYNGTSPPAVPEPAALTILATALLGLGALARRRG